MPIRFRKTTLLFTILSVLSLTVILSCGTQDRHSHTYDVVVYGGTSGGFAAAIQLARMGKTVALIEPSAHIGGMNVEGLGGTDIDNHGDFKNSVAVGGIALEFYRRIAKAYGRLEQLDSAIGNGLANHRLWRFEPHVAEKVIREWLEEYSIKLYYQERLAESDTAVKKEGQRIVSLSTETGTTYFAKVFIDASIEGDLLARSGVSTVVGREPNSIYGETRNGIREETTHAQFKVRVDPYVIPGDPKSGVIAGIQDERLGTPGAGDRRIQAYCFRMCLCKDSLHRMPFTMPEAYNRGDYEIYLRYLKAGGKLYTPYESIPNGKTDLGAWHDLSHNLYGMNHGYPSGNYAERKKIYDYHRNYTQGLFYFLANDAEVGKLAPELQAEWASWGLCPDEFQDNEGWPRQLYVRDARRMRSDYVITEHHTRKTDPVIANDPVAVAFWPPDVHSVRRIVRDGAAYNEGFVFGGDTWRPFGISYQSLYPKPSECVNLLTPTCPSSSHIAYGAIRIEFTFMALGQACGTAAAMAIDSGIAPHTLDYKKLKARLIADGQVLDAEKLYAEQLAR